MSIVVCWESQVYKTRKAENSDYEFLFELKKAAEYQPIKEVFGWDENIQREIHRKEWQEDKPTIIEIDGVAVGSYLVQFHPEHLYFGRFFLLPHYQGKGIGSQVLGAVIELASQNSLPIKLCYLQGNRVGQLYSRLGFEVTGEDPQFVHMLKPHS